eukprot:TRINITY_DN2058_c0_g1_i2.p1 TRINITY_DN2058_c0_g1~~TRINITY_DN2058_c0_g1_i2.p1  ORF type:complete len:829 (+),score=178.89 TRINITY_DN2058_c0_g1_i2:95-2581(+)
MSIDRPQGGTVVTLHIYDLTRGMMKRHRDKIFGEDVNGMWHTGVCVYGREYFFEGGITSVPSGRSRFGKPKGPYNRREVIGYTDLLKPEFEKWVRAREKERYGKLGYHLVDKNCNHFTDEAVKFLTGKSIPEEILKLPQLVHSSAIGRLFAPQVDRFFEGWQWMMLKTHWKYRRRLDAQWKNHLSIINKTEHPQPPEPETELTKHRKYLPCFSAPPSDTDIFVNLTDGAQQRRLRIVGRPPSRAYLFGPGSESSLQTLIGRLKVAFDAGPHSESVSHQAGFKALCAKLEALPVTVPKLAFANIDSGNSVVDCAAIEENVVECLIWMLSPLVAMWRVMVVLIDAEESSKKSKDKDDDSSDTAPLQQNAAEELSKYEGKGRYFEKPLSNATLLYDAFKSKKDSFLAILDAVSRMCLEASMGKVLLRGHLFSWQALKLFDEREEHPSNKVLRKLILGDNGLLGANCRDFEDLPVAAQILVFRAFSNIFGAHPSLGRLVALSMASGSENRALETLGLRARQALQNKEHTMLRLTAVSLLCNVVCNLNKELAKPRSAATGPSAASSTAPTQGTNPGTASRPSKKPVQRPISSPAPRAPVSPLPQHTISAPRPTTSVQKPAPPPSSTVGVGQVPPPVLDASVKSLRSDDPIDDKSLDRSHDTFTNKVVSTESDEKSEEESEESEEIESKKSTIKEEEEDEEKAMPLPTTQLPHSEDVGEKYEPHNLTRLRTLIVRYLCIRLSFEKDATVQQRILMTMYHACLHSETARTQLASNPLTFVHAKRMPDMESRYLSRLVEFMSRSNGVPPPEMYLTGPLLPPEWPELTADTNNRAPY